MDCIPRVGQGFTYKDLTITVTQADSRKVLEVRIQREKAGQNETPQDAANGRKRPQPIGGEEQNSHAAY